MSRSKVDINISQRIKRIETFFILDIQCPFRPEREREKEREKKRISSATAIYNTFFYLFPSSTLLYSLSRWSTSTDTRMPFLFRAVVNYLRDEDASDVAPLSVRLCLFVCVCVYSVAHAISGGCCGRNRSHRPADRSLRCGNKRGRDKEKISGNRGERRFWARLLGYRWPTNWNFIPPVFWDGNSPEMGDE